MRDVNRLDNFYNELKKLHKHFPDWRFGQFITNFISWYDNKYHNNIFYIEEDKMLELIAKFIDDMDKLTKERKVNNNVKNVL